MARITGHTKLAGVIGWPVSHSRSPLLHNHWLEQYGIDGAYLPLAVPPGRFVDALRGLQASGFAGVNVTIPHKEAAFTACDTLDETALGAGAVNTIIFRNGAVLGCCTDGDGFVANLQAHDLDPTEPTLILGAGGSARAVAAALLARGAPVTISNRNPGRAEALAAALPGLTVLDWDRRNAALADHALLVNATPAGMNGAAPIGLSFETAHRRMVVADLVYVPLETPLMRQAAEYGLRTVGGIGMLLHQARLGFNAWFGQNPTVDAALMALVAADIPPR